MEGSCINWLRKVTWSVNEDNLLRQCIDKYGEGIWILIPQRAGLRKGAWTSEEDNLLRQCVDKYGEGKWHQVPLRAGLNRCRKSCRLRWLNYLKPDIKKGKFSSDEVDLLLRLHKLHRLSNSKIDNY